MLVAQSCPTLYSPVDCSSPGSSVQLEWVAISFSSQSSWPRFKPRPLTLHADSSLNWPWLCVYFWALYSVPLICMSVFFSAKTMLFLLLRLCSIRKKITLEVQLMTTLKYEFIYHFCFILLFSYSTILESKSVSYSSVSDSLRPPWTVALQALLSMKFSR